MISYTVTTRKTQNARLFSYTFSEKQTLSERDLPTYFFFPLLEGVNLFRHTFEQAITQVGFTSSDGATSAYNFVSASYSGFNGPFETASASYLFTASTSIGSNLDATFEYNLKVAEKIPESEVVTFEDTYFLQQTLTPTTISGITTTAQNRQRFIPTSKTQIAATTVATTSERNSSTFITLKNTTANETIQTFSLSTENVVTTTTQEIQTNLVTENEFSLGPRATATIIQDFQNECVWLPTATNIEGAGPWSLTFLANSHTTDITALPIYSTSPLVVLAESNDTFPEETYETITEIYTTSTVEGETTREIWTTNSNSAFPLVSLQSIHPKLTTITVENIYQIFTENNSNLTKAITKIQTKFTNSAEIKFFGLSYQEFFESTFTTTQNETDWSTTVQTDYDGFFWDTNVDFEAQELDSFITFKFGRRISIEGTNVEQIQIRAFSPCAVSHVETNFRQAWGLHGNSGPEPKNQISFDGSLSLKFTDFVELLPGVSAPFPTTYSWSTGNSTLSASLAGNAITISTTSGTGSNASTASSTYQFQGNGSAYTEQISDRSFFLNSQGLPALSFFGPHAATGPVETRARPGEYVRIVQDSLGAFTLSTLTLETTSASIISDNAILFPGEKSFYTTTGGVPFLTFSRNPIP
jgi:hypothetical protein